MLLIGFTPFFILMLLPILYYSLNALDLLPEKESYSPDEKSAALGELAEYILSYRDGVDNGFEESSVVNKLSKELIVGAVRDTTQRQSRPQISDKVAESNTVDTQEGNSEVRHMIRRHRHSVFFNTRDHKEAFKPSSVVPEEGIENA